MDALTEIARRGMRRIEVFPRLTREPGTGQLGWFHGHGFDVIEHSGDPDVQFSVMIVELDNGNVDTFPPGCCRFVV